MTPDELARKLGISPKTLRAWLRGAGFRSPAESGQRWSLDQRMIDAATAQFGNQPSVLTGERVMKRPKERAADYVIELCDEILGEAARREHSFPWLLGDPGKNGRRTPLRVDAHYERHGIVVEYDGLQHAEPVERFDRRPTLSGVKRGAQRRLYDERRAREIPVHGLRLVIVVPGDLDSRRSGSLRRNRTHDREVLARLLGVETGAEE